MLNAQGGIECDLTVTRLAEDAFYIVTGTGFATHDFELDPRNIPAGMRRRLIDVTSAFAVLPLMGPRARDVLQRSPRTTSRTRRLPFGSAREIRIAGAPVRALRVTYVGELGFELHVPIEYALAVYDALIAAGAPFGLANAGYRAIESLRLEKGYRAWGADIGPDHTPLEAGLGLAVKLAATQPFLGREALERQRRDGLNKRLAGFTVDDPEVVLLGRETIFRDGERVGWLTSGGFGYTLGKRDRLRLCPRPGGRRSRWLRPAATSSRSRPSASRRSSTCARSTTRDDAGSRLTRRATTRRYDATLDPARPWRLGTELGGGGDPRDAGGRPGRLGRARQGGARAGDRPSSACRRSACSPRSTRRWSGVAADAALGRSCRSPRTRRPRARRSRPGCTSWSRSRSPRPSPRRARSSSSPASAGAC